MLRATKVLLHRPYKTICPNVKAMDISAFPMVDEGASDVFGEVEMYWEFKVFGMGVCEMGDGEGEKMYRKYFEIDDVVVAPS